MMRRSLDSETIFRKKIVDFLNIKSMIRGAPIIEIICGDFSNKLKIGRSPDIETFFENYASFLKKLHRRRSPYIETILRKKTWTFLC